MTKFMAAGKFKEQCLSLMDQVKKTKKRIVITKRRIPIAQLVPIQEQPKSLFGCMKGTGKAKGDIIHPIDEKWDADS